ncbi:MAG: hypothetical protein IJ191_06835 [Treponema sp.]|nr:hypothetical protein [Treponema sp.]
MAEYNFSFNTRYFFDEGNIYFRKGIWNTIDGVLPFDQIDNSTLFIDFLNAVNDDDKEKSEKIQTMLSAKDTAHIDELLNNGFLYQKEHEAVAIGKILTGQNYSLHEQHVSFDFITDAPSLLRTVESLKNEYGYTYNLVQQDCIDTLSDIHYADKINAVQYEENRLRIQHALSAQAPKLILLQNINTALLRNINRMTEKAPLFIGFIDGPFMVFLSVIPKQTACWDCFEQRMLAFVKDHVLYNKFMHTVPQGTEGAVYNLHMTQLLHMGLQEVFSWCLLTMSKFMGRCLFVYLPTYEVHFQNINRISSCPHCGYISALQNTQNNVSLNRVLSELIAAGNKS